jgi:hypothetical protein
MKMGSKYKDINKEDFMKALFLELQGHNKMVSFEKQAKILHDFVLGNPTNEKDIKGLVTTKVEAVGIAPNGIPIDSTGRYIVQRTKPRRNMGKKKKGKK